jgi:hypothetical protein
MKNMRVTALSMAVLILFLSGCSKNYIPNTEIEDNEFNREVISFCERYRRAVENLNIGLIMSLASPRYFDNSGTLSGDDDVDRSGLEEILKTRFRAITALRYEIKYIEVYECSADICVELTYTMSFKYTVGGRTQWANKTADNRLELEPVDGGYLILSGM